MSAGILLMLKKMSLWLKRKGWWRSWILFWIVRQVSRRKKLRWVGLRWGQKYGFFFHSMVKKRSNASTIQKLVDNGLNLDDPSQIEDIFWISIPIYMLILLRLIALIWRCRILSPRIFLAWLPMRKIWCWSNVRRNRKLN